MRPTWVLQTNLGNPAHLRQMTEACARLGLPVIETQAIPFSDELPAVPVDRPTLFYGATRFMLSVHRSGRWRPGVFFDEEAFRFSTWRRHYGAHLLNAEAELTTLSALSARQLPADQLLFVRPDRDLKEFAGEIITHGDLGAWYQRISAGGFTLDGDCPIVVAEPVNIAHEWRLFLVGGRVCGSSHYRSYHRLDVFADVPAAVIRFAEERAATFSPAPVFVMDVGRSGPELYVIELNCFHSAGFYASNVERVIDAVSEWVTVSYSPRT